MSPGTVPHTSVRVGRLVVDKETILGTLGGMGCKSIAWHDIHVLFTPMGLTANPIQIQSTPLF